jgi:hypothetical protein
MPLFRDGVAQGLRFFRRDASVAVPAAGILALGLGANIAIFAVAHAVLLRPLPVADQQSLVIMWESGRCRTAISRTGKPVAAS